MGENSMPENNLDDQKKHATRRTVLTSLTATGLAVPSVVSAQKRKSNAMVLRQATPDQPIKPKEIIDYQVDSMKRISSVNNSVEPLLVEPILEGESIVAYSHYIDDGIMHSYLGSVPKGQFKPKNEAPSSTLVKHQKAEKFLDGSASINGNGFTTDGMKSLRLIEQDVGECPHGKVQVTYDVLQDTGNPRIYGLTSRSRVIPGENECNSHWENQSLNVNHDWDNSPIVTEVKDHDPSGNASGGGSYSFNIGYYTAGISWSHSTPDIIRDDDSTSTSFDQTFTWSEDHDETNIFRCASIAKREKELEGNEWLCSPGQEYTAREGAWDDREEFYNGIAINNVLL